MLMILYLLNAVLIYLIYMEVVGSCSSMIAECHLLMPLENTTPLENTNMMANAENTMFY